VPPSPPHDRGWPNAAPSPSGRKRLTTAILFCFICAIIAIWLRNRDILRDLYDYSSVIVAAGKIEAGLRPYVDFRSTMQSATYALNRGVELLFGANYLALTWGGLIVSLGGGAALAWLWRCSFGWTAAIVLAGTVAVSGFSQHVVVFYNPVGLLCLSVVSAALAHDPRLWRLRSPEAVLACLALVLGGTNKINFHAFTCGIAALLIARAWWMKEASGRTTLASAGMLALCGAVLPLGLELLWTGATLTQWIDNVLRLPAERVGFVTEFLRRDIILQPAYDLYHHFIFKQLTLVGLLLVAGTAMGVLVGLARDPARRRAALWLLVATPVFALGGLLLTVTNVESLALTSLSFVVGAAALWSSFAGRLPVAARRLGAVVLPTVGLLWALVGGYAAWEGSRVMFSTAEPQRASFIRLEAPSPSLEYLRGVRLDAGLLASLQQAATELERLKAKRGNLSTVLFGPAMEWMERAYPESILRGMPVWFHVGTALRENDSPWLKQQLATKRIDRIVLNPNWESWPGPFRDYLDRDFRAVGFGSCLRIYEAIPPEEAAQRHPLSVAALHPLMFCRRTQSNIHLGTTSLPPRMDYCDSPWGEYLGRTGSSRWVWNEGARDLSGTFVAVLDRREGPPVRIAWRIVAAGDERVLAAGNADVSTESPQINTPFALQASAGPIRLEIEVPPADEARVTAGWRALWIRQAGLPSPQPPPAAVDGGELGYTEIASTGAPLIRHPPDAPVGDWFPAPFEAWREHDACTPWKVRVNTKRRRDLAGSPTIVFLVWYKAGRIEILREKMANPDDEETIELEGWMPEPGGRLGVAARAADIAQPPNCRVRIESWTP
jgi:hypothetical protein